MPWHILTEPIIFSVSALQMTPSPTTLSPSMAAVFLSFTGPMSQQHGPSSSCGNWSRYWGSGTQLGFDLLTCTVLLYLLLEMKLKWRECLRCVRLVLMHAPEYVNKRGKCFQVRSVEYWSCGYLAYFCAYKCVGGGRRCEGGMFWLEPLSPDRLKLRGLKLIQRRFVKSPCLNHNILLPSSFFPAPLLL